MTKRSPGSTKNESDALPVINGRGFGFSTVQLAEEAMASMAVDGDE